MSKAYYYKSRRKAFLKIQETTDTVGFKEFTTPVVIVYIPREFSTLEFVLCLN